MRIGLRVPDDVAIALEKYLNATGQEKTEYVLGLIRKDLGIAKVETLIEKVESHDIRIAAIEARLDAD
jgi:hypothetical protein